MYILPNLTATASSHLPRWWTAQGYQSTCWLRQVPKLKVRLCLAWGFCPPFWGGSTHSPSKVRFCLTMFYRGLLPPNFFGGLKICTPPFFNFGPGGIALGRTQRAPLLLILLLSSSSSSSLYISYHPTNNMRKLSKPKIP